MLSLLRRCRRGQIRGIDFSLAMIIFVLTMSQVLVLTSTFISNSQSSQEVSSNISTNQNYANQFLTNPGSTQWETSTTSTLQSNNWQFGLSTGNGSIDPFKLGRLGTNNIANYLIGYNDLRSATSVDRPFRIQTKSTINVTIISSNLVAGPEYNVVGQVVEGLSGIENADIDVFSLDPGTGVVSVSTTTDEQGNFNVNVPTTTNNGYQVLVALANYGSGNQDVDYAIEGTATIENQTLLPGTSTSGFSIDVDSALSAPTYYSFYVTGNQTSTSSTSTIAVAEKGLSLIISATATDIALSTFPLLIDNELHIPIEPTDLGGKQAVSTEKLIAIRGVLMRYILTTWS